MGERSAHPRRLRLDSGWLYLVAGGATLAATVLIPAGENARAAEAEAASARLWAEHQSRRVARYSEYLDALERGDPTLIESLAAANLHLTPTGKRAILPADTESIARRDVGIFDEIEPAAPPAPAAFAPTNSTLARLARGERSRLALLAGSALCILFGLLPPATRRKRGSG